MSNLAKKNKYSTEQLFNYLEQERVDTAASILADTCFHLSNNAGWWKGVWTPSEARELVAQKIALIHSELSEALEADRKDLMDDKLPHRHGVEVELADAVIRIFDLAGALDFDIIGAVVEKLKYNQTRQDHKLSERAKVGGKKY